MIRAPILSEIAGVETKVTVKKRKPWVDAISRVCTAGDSTCRGTRLASTSNFQFRTVTTFVTAFQPDTYAICIKTTSTSPFFVLVRLPSSPPRLHHPKRQQPPSPHQRLGAPCFTLSQTRQAISNHTHTLKGKIENHL